MNNYKQTYIEKLKDPRWQRKRLEVLNRDNFTCQNCGDTTETLHVHHKRYLTQYKNPWEYPDNLLITLCATCHEGEKEQVADMTHDIGCMLQDTFTSWNLHSIASGFANIKIIENQKITAETIGFIISNEDWMKSLVKAYREYVSKLDDPWEVNNGGL